MIVNCAAKKIYIQCSNDICKTFIKLKLIILL